MEIWYQIIELALNTPSPHNVQPWKFKLLSATEACLYIDRSRMLPKEDLTGSFVLSAMSMMVESLRILAANRKHALHAEVIYEDSTAALIPFAKLRLEFDESISGQYDDSLFIVRRTSRLKYEDKRIPSEILNWLSQITKNFGQQFGSTIDSTLIEKALRWNIEALFQDLNEPNYHSEISEYFRYNDQQIKQYCDGLDYRCMNLSKLELWICAKAPWLLRVPGLHIFMRIIYRQRLGSVRCLGWLSGPFWTAKEAVVAGKALMNFWLETAKYGLYFHPLGNLVTNKTYFSKISASFNNDSIWLIFKIGFSKEPPKSQRLSLDQVLIKTL